LERRRNPIAENKNISLEGKLIFSGGLECPVEMSVTLEPGTTGKVHTFTVSNTKACVVIGALRALGCSTVDEHEGTGLVGGWPVRITGAVLKIKKIVFHWGVTGIGVCDPGFIFSTEGEITATPNSVNAVSNVELSGELESGLGPVEVGGKLNVVTLNNGTYSI
jgi:hypothetical protein